ncbi:MAG: cytochrome c5 [Gammaproteobacteria bacterium]
MNKQDDAFIRQFGLILGVLIIFAFCAHFLGNNIATSAVQEAAATEAATLERIAPIGKVNALPPAPEKAPAKAPMQVAAAPVVAAPAVAAASAAVVAAPAPKPAVAPAVAAAASDDGRPASEVYKMACMACHAIGIANAPKTGDKAAWSARLAQGGVPALVASVIKGKGAMPPNAGNPSITEAEIKRTVEWFLKDAGIDAQ